MASNGVSLKESPLMRLFQREIGWFGSSRAFLSKSNVRPLMLWLHQLLTGMTVVCGCLRNWFRRKRAGNRGDDDGCENSDNDASSLFFELRSLEFATNYFSDLNKLGHGGFGPVYKTWQLFQEGNTKELVDPNLDKYNTNEVAMCIHLGLLCCQASVAERPTMSSVNLMISSDSFSLPKPGVPGLQGRTGRYSTTTTSLTDAKSNTKTTSEASASRLYNGTTRATAGSSFVEDYSRNSMSISSMEEGAT
ncbi:hypothetical protein V2J09_014879 [Rumex salicifolius]